VLNLINNKTGLINKFIRNENSKKSLINAIGDNFNNYLKNIDEFDINKIVSLVELIIKIKMNRNN